MQSLVNNSSPYFIVWVKRSQCMCSYASHRYRACINKRHRPSCKNTISRVNTTAQSFLPEAFFQKIGGIQ